MPSILVYFLIAGGLKASYKKSQRQILVNSRFCETGRRLVKSEFRLHTEYKKAGLSGHIHIGARCVKNPQCRTKHGVLTG